MDCSVTMGWCFEDEGDDSSEAILNVLGPWEAVVPSIWSFEVANTLLVGERRKRISKLESSNFLSFLAVLPVTIDDSSTERALWARSSLWLENTGCLHITRLTSSWPCGKDCL